MLTCPRGHLVCSSCRAKMTTEGQELCPVCREPMGNNKSLLAMVVLKNMEHECTNKGCKEKLTYEGAKKHKEELCKFRNITCPGCLEYLPLSSFDEHAKTCDGLDVEMGNHMTFSAGKEFEDDIGPSTYSTSIFKRRNETFALIFEVADNKFRIECVMFAEREKCDRFLTTILITDPKCETFFNWQINPTPIGTDEGSVIIVHKTSLAKIITTNDRGKYKFEINFKVSEKRPHQDNNIN